MTYKHTETGQHKIGLTTNNADCQPVHLNYSGVCDQFL